MILDVSNDHSGKLVNAQSLLKLRKKLSPAFVASAPNQSANDGIYVIFTHVISVPALGTSVLFW